MFEDAEVQNALMSLYNGIFDLGTTILRLMRDKYKIPSEEIAYCLIFKDSLLPLLQYLTSSTS